MTKIYFAIMALAVFSGCALNSGVVSLGPDAFMVSKQAASGFSGAGTLKAEAIQEANQHCAANSKSILVTNTTEAQPPYIAGNFPKAEVQFMCLAAGDQRLTRAEAR